MFENNNKEEITPLFDEKTLLKLLNLFTPDFENIESIVSILCHSPYPIDVIKRVCYQWYNKKENEDGDIIEEYINKYYEYEKSNKWFDTIMNKYYEPQTIKDFGWTDEDEKIYNKLAFASDNELSQKQIQQKEDIKRKHFEIKYKLKCSLMAEEQMKYWDWEDYTKLFKDVKNIITPYCFDNNYYNKLFIVDLRKYYILNEDNTFKQIDRKDFENIIRSHKINENKLTHIYGVEKLNYIRKYNGVFLSNKYNEKVEEILNIFKSGFVNGYDYIYYMRWLSMKLNNPRMLIPRDIVCLFGTIGIKTMFIDAFNDFIKVSNIGYNTVTQCSFNDWIKSSIVIINEIPDKTKDEKNKQHFQYCIERYTSSEYVGLKRRYKREKTIRRYANFIINSNYINCGGIFNNPADNTIFDRFKIIKNQTIKNDDAEILYNNLKDKYILYNLYEYIKNEFKPMEFNELYKRTEYEHEYERIICKMEYRNKRVLDHDTIKQCIDNGKYLKIDCLVDMLINAGHSTSIDNEESFLLNADIIDFSSDDHYIITDYNKFKETYMKEDNKEEINI